MLIERDRIFYKLYGALRRFLAIVLVGLMMLYLCGYGYRQSENTADIASDKLAGYIADIEAKVEALEKSIQNDSLTQTEYNEKTYEVYKLWDNALNTLWGALRKTLDKGTMRALTAEELDWIAQKERAAAEAGAAYEGSTMQPMIVNNTAAEITKDRVYELMELLD